MQALGRYELLRPLARGGMAEVYLARRRGAAGVDKRVVVKRIRRERASDPRFLELFVREARLSMSLAHQNIVPVFDFGRVGDELFLAMEHIDGKDLGETLDQSREAGVPPSPLLVAWLGAECCRALAYAHSRRGDDGAPLGLVHRDVTPRNVLLSTSGEVKLVDFGVASLGADVEAKVRGTPAYMAPEQARGESLDGRADLFALGVVLWEALAGQRMRLGDGERALLVEARTRPAPRLPAGVPAPLVDAIARATVSAPALRFANADEMLDALEAFVVTERAKDPAAPAPARQLVTWLRALFPRLDDGPEAAGAGAIAPFTAGPIKTFMDDGEAAVLGAATQRSLAGTAAEAEAEAEAGRRADATSVGAPPALAPPAAPPTAGLASASASASPLVASAPAGRKPHRARWAVALVGVAGIGGATLFALRDERGGGATGAATDAAPSVVASTDAAPAPSPSPADAGAPPPAPADAAPGPLPADTRDAGPRPRPARADAGTAAGAVTPALPPRRVTIGARPWARFTVDDNPTVHETPETLLLAPGPHTIRFENREARLARTITIDVPADRDLQHVEVLTPE